MSPAREPGHPSVVTAGSAGGANPSKRTGRGPGRRARRRSLPRRAAAAAILRVDGIARRTALTATAWRAVQRTVPGLRPPAGPRPAGSTTRPAQDRRRVGAQTPATLAARERASTIAELAAAFDLGIADVSAAPRLGWDVARTELGPLLRAAADLAGRGGARALVHCAGATDPLTGASADGLARRARRAPHLRLLLVTQDGRPLENALIRVWRHGPLDTWTSRSPLAPVPRISSAAGRTDATRALPLDTAVNEPVDAVFTWVDAADPAWRALAAQHRDLEALDADRFVQADELKYALRSLDQFAPWFRRIVVFSNCAPPPWFRASERFAWVDHADVIPASGLPLFNSHAIESWLHRIPGLAERFVYLNDDFMLWDSVGPGTFHTWDGRAIAHLQGPSSVAFLMDLAERGLTSEWQTAAVNGARLLRERYGVVPTRLHSHSPYALLRSVMERIEEEFPEDVARVRAARFREHTDLSLVSFFFHHFAAVIGRGTDRPASVVMLRNVNYRNERIRKRLAGATFVCLNDGRGSGSEPEYQAFKERFLESHLPVPSGAER